LVGPLAQTHQVGVGGAVVRSDDLQVGQRTSACLLAPDESGDEVGATREEARDDLIIDELDGLVRDSYGDLSAHAGIMPP
jgi:hypothetical protein